MPEVPMQCPGCKHLIAEPDARFCPHCGQSLADTLCCAYCGNYIAPGAKYCSHCGRGTDSEAEREQTNHHLVRLGISETDWQPIPVGNYCMGSPGSEKNRFDNEAQHDTTIAAFEILKSPVTFAMYDAYCTQEALPKPDDETWGRENRPVIHVSYWDAVQYAIWLQKQTGWLIRLPTEAEWEYACRAGTTTPFWTGSSIAPDQANYNSHYSYDGSAISTPPNKTTPVDKYPANPWGLNDMHGNVWEWCASLYDESYSGLELSDATADVTNHHPRVVRGGSWYNLPGALRSASRNQLAPDYSHYRVGFRLVREVN
ncbi:MAG: SUMF1/EgtB/PvdO family nonheme iron enzyme [Candidatus Sedimenticola sp. PURPLELP]